MKGQSKGRRNSLRVVVDVSTTCIICIALMKIAETKAANDGAFGAWIAELDLPPSAFNVQAVASVEVPKGTRRTLFESICNRTSTADRSR